MNIVAYCRVSTEKEDQLNSLEVQKQFFEEYAEKNNHTLVKIYADEGISGTKTKNRTQFLRLMKDANLGSFDMVVVKDISRFARNTVDLLNSTRELKSLGIETTFLTANMTVLGQSEFVLTVFGALAQEESANMSKRVKFGKKMNAQKGRVPNIVYGYDKTKGDYFNLTINPFEAKIIRRIYDLYLHSGYGTNKIAQLLNSEGLRTKRNCQWTQKAILRILTSPLYTGKIINGKEEITDFLTSKREKKDESDWQIVDKPELRIIDDASFVAAANILEKRMDSFNLGQGRQSNRHLFSTLIKCDCCGSSFRRIERKSQNTYVGWVCNNRNANGKDSCANATKIGENDLKLALKEYFMEILANKSNIVQNITKEFNRIYQSKEENSDYENELTERLAKASKTRTRYLEMFEDDLITRDELRKKVSTLNTEIEKCQNELKLVQYNLGKSDHLEQVLSSTLQDLDSILDMDNMTNAQLKRLIEKIVVDEHGKVDVYLKLLSDIGLDQSVLISDSHTQRHHRPHAAH